MKKFKECPACRANNPESEVLCQLCGIDITAVTATVETIKNETPDAQANELMKKCPTCSAMNPEYQIICDECQTDLSNVPVSIKSQSVEKVSIQPVKNIIPRLLLFSNKHFIEIEIKTGDIFGRCNRCKNENERSQTRCDLKYEKKNHIDCRIFNTVSRRHAQFVFKDKNYYIVTHSDSKNATMLNGQELNKGSEYKICSGDQLQFSSKLILDVAIESN